MKQIGPDTEQMGWRDLFGALYAYRGDQWADDLILPWASDHFELLEELVDRHKLCPDLTGALRWRACTR